MLSRLPLEIQVKLFHLVPSSALKHTNSYFYTLYNNLYYDKILSTFGEDIIQVIIKILPWLKLYIKSLDAFRYECRNAIASRLSLEDKKFDSSQSDPNPLHCTFIKDSWKYIYSILKNKRLFAEYSDYKIDEPTNYIYSHFVEINRTYLLSYTKSLWLAPGSYNLNIGLVIKHGSGLGTTKFEIKYQDEKDQAVIQTFYPPTNINEILPKQQFCFLKIGEFKVPDWDQSVKQKKEPERHNKLRKIQFVMEEIGLYLKSGFRIFFLDISQPSLLFNEFDLLYYSVKESNYKHFINLPLKNLYKALNYVQNGGTSDNLSMQQSLKLYGEGDPFEIFNQYDRTFLSEFGEIEVLKIEGHKGEKEVFTYDENSLAKYAEFFFENKIKNRYFKFSTIYQRRQFINRFGDFELDWKDEGSSKDSSEKICTYDKEGLKWKIPILGEL
ncbi:uncharacterized protein RJT20DRAFT_43928 [Scheffersomyces xylosifermentans]|uniref:uncharacterized protein n=1 Tax=Scheffersomyces xylosifermentans TaxID=1304137 RepID=UPI00315DF497